MRKYFTQKNLLIAGVIFFLAIMAIIIYRMFFEFKSKDVKDYIKEEADKYVGSETYAYAIIQDSVQHILSSHNLTQQVCRTAKQNGTSKEQELVHAGIMLCKTLGYTD